MTAPDSTTPPLPDLSGAVAHGFAPANDWRLLVESVPLFAETGLFVPTKAIPVAGRSPLRTGTIRFSADGMTMEGMEPKPLPDWYNRLSPFVGLIGAVGYMAYGIGAFARLPGTVRGVGMLVGLFCGVVVPRLAVWLLDKERQELVQIVSWGSLHVVQVDKKRRYVTMAYTTERYIPALTQRILWGLRTKTTEATTATVLEYLTLNRLEPSVVEGVATTLAHFAPNALHERVTLRRGFNWITSWVTVAALIIFAVVMVGVFALLFSFWWKRSHP
ncbi:MAG: hypothetical protein H7Y38_08990 [Armatimonadetes bacterium]|nr:hypothetical protein [Armatimonadota bacterium]